MVKQEHYVPRFYLRKFSNQDKISVYEIEKKKFFKTNINKIACEKYFYDLNYDSLKELLIEQKKIYNIPDDVFEEKCNDVQFVEKALSRLENEFSVLLNKFENDYSMINDEEFLRKFFLFAHVQSLRTVGLREGLENIASQTKEWLGKLNIKNIDYPLDLEASDIAKRNQLNEILSIASVYKKAIVFFENYNLYIGVNKTNFEFILSDNPLTYFMLGFNDICFPINPYLSIIMQVKEADAEHKICNITPDENNIINLTEFEILKYNVLQLNSNARFLFGSESSLKKFVYGIEMVQKMANSKLREDSNK